MNDLCIDRPELKPNLGTPYTEEVLLNSQYFKALCNDIEKAKQCIDLSVYIFSTDALGLKIANALKVAAHRGVHVRLLIDGIGARFTTKAMLLDLLNANIEVRIFHPLPWHFLHIAQAAHVPEPFLNKIFYLLTKINSRNHRKVCIIDQSIVYVSSANIDHCHLSHDEGGDNWRDTSIRITGSDISYLQYAFDRAWRRFKINSRNFPSYRTSSNHSIYYFNFTRRLRRRIYKKLMWRIKHAQKRIWITNAYFVPDSFLMKALIDARERGVDVRILLPSTCDVFISSLVANTFYADLLKHGVAIYEYLRGILHAKIMIIDDWFSIGSSNLNSRSIKHDLEADVIIQTANAKINLENQFLKDLNDSKRIDNNHLKKNPKLKNFMGKLCLFLRHWI